MRTTSKGFTLIETLLAIFILSTATVAVLGLTSSGTRSADQSSQTIIAEPLLSQVVEAMRQLRDTNYMSGNDWLTGIDPECTGASGCSLDFSGASPVFTACSGTCPELTIYNNEYSTNQSGTATGFTRTITVTSVSSTEASVAAEVTWSERGQDFSVNTVETLRDWAPPSEALLGPESCAVSCTLPGQSGRTTYSFDDWLSFSSGVWDGDFVDISGLTPGYYSIRTQSYDGYSGRESSSQSNERWYLEFADSGQNPLLTTGATTDLDDLVAEACVFETLQTVAVTSSTSQVRPRHQSNISGSQDSVYAVCAAFDEQPNTAPVITILGDNPYTHIEGSSYVDPGATAFDNEQGDISGSIVVTNNVGTDPGEYTVVYDITDEIGATDQAIRTVNVEESHDCNNGVDDDGDTLIDGDDPGCSVGEGENEDADEGGGGAECSDGIDNDGDGLVDWDEDPSCEGDPGKDFEAGECEDGMDNDGDFLIDYTKDPSCKGDPNGLSEF